MFTTAVAARDNSEPLFTGHGHWFGPNALDDSERRRLSLQPLDKVNNFCGTTLHLYKYAGGIVTDEAAQSQGCRQRMHEGTKSNALHNAGNTNSAPTGVLAAKSQ